MASVGDIGQLTVSYICPKCGHRIDRLVPYIKKDKGRINLAAAGWCSWRSCEARHRMTYKVHSNNGQQPKIKDLHFVSDEKEFSKRMKVLAWC